MPSFGGAASGAATGAGIGSIIPGVGTGIGAGIGALFGLFKGGKKKDAAQPKAPTSGSPLASGLSPELDAMMRQILQQGIARNQASEPLHQAVLLMAQRMAPSWAMGGDPTGGARMRQATAAAQAPRPAQTLSPQVLEAIQRLSGKFA